MVYTGPGLLSFSFETCQSNRAAVCLFVCLTFSFSFQFVLFDGLSVLLLLYIIVVEQWRTTGTGSPGILKIPKILFASCSLVYMEASHTTRKDSLNTRSLFSSCSLVYMEASHTARLDTHP